MSGRSISVLVLLLGCFATRAGARNEEWPAALAKFKARFVFKGPESGTEARREALLVLGSSKDGRAVPEVFGAIKTQERHLERLRRDWEAQEKAWKEKDDRLMGPYLAKMERAKERGEEQVSLTPEEADWFGSNKTAEKRKPEKERIGRLYLAILDEDELIPYALRQAARVVSEIEGEEQSGAAAAFLGAVKGADSERRLASVKALGFVRGDRATDLLETFSKDPQPEVVQVALEAIGRQNTERGIAILFERLQDPRWQVRASAIEGLTFYRDARVMDALLEGARKEEGVLQRNFFVAMARIVRESVPATIDAWDSFWKAQRATLDARWKGSPLGEPVLDDPPDVPIPTSEGSTYFYGISTNSKHIVFVLDVSGSMGLEKVRNDAGKLPIEIARAEIKNAIRTMPAAEQGDERGEASFNVILFSTSVLVYKPGKMVPSTRRTKDDAQAWVDEKVNALGGTNIYDALESAFNVVSATSDAKNLKRGADTIYFMTDGKPTHGKLIDPELILKEVKAWNRTRKLTIHTIGVGKEADSSFLERLATQNGGQFLSR